MMELEWYHMQGISEIRKIYKRITGKQFSSVTYAHKTVMDEESGSALLASSIASECPYMAARYGYVEMETMAAVYYYKKNGNDRFLDKVMNKADIFNNAGFFPQDREKVIRFGELMMEYSQELDMLGVWYIPYEEYFINKLAKNTVLTKLRTYEPWNASIPWTGCLKNKKVLVVHPFAETIQSQYQKRELLFANTDMLPKFELLTYKAVQTIAGNRDPRFDDWFEALDFMFSDIMKMDFDVAILGCGAYGFPLAAKIKKAGKQAVHIGGATQLLFGIKGSRWDHHPTISKLYNENWIRPGEKEKPEGFHKIESGCYW